MTSAWGTCQLGFRKFDPNIKTDLYFAQDCTGNALNTACQTQWDRGREGDVFSVAAAVAVGGLRKGSWDCPNECNNILRSPPVGAPDMDAIRPPSPTPATASTNYYSDHGGTSGTGGLRGSTGHGTSSWEGGGKAKEEDSDGRRGLCIDKVDDEGKFIRLVNDSATQDEELGCCVLRQAFQGHPIIEFYFPPAIFLPAGSSVTVWSTGRAEAHAGQSSPPIDDDEPHWHFQFKELFRWAIGTDYLTTLCRANGKVLTSSSQSFGSYGGNPSDKSIGPSPGIISKYNFITNRYKIRQDQERAARGSISLEFAELLKKRMVSRFPPRVFRRDGAQAKPKGGIVRQSPYYQPDPCFPLIYPD